MKQKLTFAGIIILALALSLGLAVGSVSLSRMLMTTCVDHGYCKWPTNERE